MEALSSAKMTVENCLGTKNMCLFWISLTMVTLCAECYCGTLSVRQPYFAKSLGYFACKCQASCTQLDLQLFMAVHLIGYGSVPILRSVFYLSLNSLNLEKHLAGKWLQYMLLWSKLSPLGYRHSTTVSLPWYNCGANAEMVVVTTLRSDVYHLLHVLIKVTVTFWHESGCYLIFLKFLAYTLQSEQLSS
jgi:hypothetical protein